LTKCPAVPTPCPTVSIATDIDTSNTVSIGSILDLVDACELHVPNTNVLYNQLNLGNIREQNPAFRISESTLIALWQLLEEFSPSPDFGLSLGQTISPESKGLLASWVSQSDTLGEALQIFRNNIALMNTSEHWDMENDGNTCSITLHIDVNYPRPAIERSMSAMVCWARMLSSHPFPMVSANFTMKRPEHIEAYSALFGNNVHFECLQNRLTFKSHLLSLPIASSSRYLKEIIEDQAMTALKQLRSPPDINDVVKEIVIEYLNEGKLPRIDEVSQRLHMSRQTLYRKLEQKKTNYKTIVDEVRKIYAAKHLSADNPNIIEISYSLGFKDTSSFYKAFKRWFNMTPKEHINMNSQ